MTAAWSPGCVNRLTEKSPPDRAANPDRIMGRKMLITAPWSQGCVNQLTDKSPPDRAANPDRIMGRKMPVTATWSPGCVSRVSSPRASTVIVQGMSPVGT